METATQTQGATETLTRWTLDPAHTMVEFSVKHMMITTVKGRFAGVSGAVVIDEADPSRSEVAVEMEASSIDTRTEQRDAHLRSPDFLDADSHPQLLFRSTRIEGAPREVGDRFRVFGELTIRGLTREVVLDAEFEGRGRDPWGGDRVSFSASTVIDRREFGLVWNQGLETGGVLVSNDVRISLEAQAVRAG